MPVSDESPKLMFPVLITWYPFWLIYSRFSFCCYIRWVDWCSKGCIPCSWITGCWLVCLYMVAYLFWSIFIGIALSVSSYLILDYWLVCVVAKKGLIFTTVSTENVLYSLDLKLMMNSPTKWSASCFTSTRKTPINLFTYTSTPQEDPLFPVLPFSTVCSISNRRLLPLI